MTSVKQCTVNNTVYPEHNRCFPNNLAKRNRCSSPEERNLEFDRVAVVRAVSHKNAALDMKGSPFARMNGLERTSYVVVEVWATDPLAEGPDTESNEWSGQCSADFCSGNDRWLRCVDHCVNDGTAFMCCCLAVHAV